MALQRKVELKKLREKLMAGTRDSVLDSFDELNHRKIKKTEVDVRGANAKKFMNMFNNGEVPIFIDCGIIPIFIGQALVGPFTPNLTYLTVYPSEDARLASWNSFRDHPAWKVLSKVEKYKGTVSKIHKHVLVPKAYSEM